MDNPPLPGHKRRRALSSRPEREVLQLWRPGEKLAAPAIGEMSMAEATLSINSRNYGSWSLRGFLLCRMAGLDVAVEMSERLEQRRRHRRGVVAAEDPTRGQQQAGEQADDRKRSGRGESGHGSPPGRCAASEVTTPCPKRCGHESARAARRR